MKLYAFYSLEIIYNIGGVLIESTLNCIIMYNNIHTVIPILIWREIFLFSHKSVENEQYFNECPNLYVKLKIIFCDRWDWSEFTINFLSHISQVRKSSQLIFFQAAESIVRNNLIHHLMKHDENFAPYKIFLKRVYEFRMQKATRYVVDT